MCSFINHSQNCLLSSSLVKVTFSQESLLASFTNYCLHPLTHLSVYHYNCIQLICVTVNSASVPLFLPPSRKQWFTAMIVTKLMILIFCFQSNKHWHENEPQAEASNEKMKLVFQLTDQKHFIHYNQAFIWRDLVCVCGAYCMCECGGSMCKYIIHASVCAMLLVIATPRRSLWHFPTFCTRSSWLSDYM